MNIKIFTFFHVTSLKIDMYLKQHISVQLAMFQVLNRLMYLVPTGLDSAGLILPLKVV